jgi:ankyrin repeat protein
MNSITMNVTIIVKQNLYNICMTITTGIDIVQILIKHNVDINQRGGYLNKTPIYYACSKGHTDIVQILLDNNCDIPDDAIIRACTGGYEGIVEMLIKHSVDINLSDSVLDLTPINSACLNGNTEVVQILLDNNCDIPDGVHHQECHNYCQAKSVQHLYDL